MSQSDLERTFETYWRQLGGPDLEKEYRFHPTRKWRLDFALPCLKIGFECEGGTRKDKSRHTTGDGYTKDCIKYNAATRLNWKVYRFTSDMLRDDPVGHLQPIIELMRQNVYLRESD